VRLVEMMVSYWFDSRSRCVSASRMPSVMNLISEVSATCSVKRTWKPTSCAHRVPSSLGHASRHAARGNASRLGAADHAINAATGRQRQQGQLRGLARTGFAGNHHDLRMASMIAAPSRAIGKLSSSRISGTAWARAARFAVLAAIAATSADTRAAAGASLPAPKKFTSTGNSGRAV
jgi:hypothetical protein